MSNDVKGFIGVVIGLAIAVSLVLIVVSQTRRPIEERVQIMQANRATTPYTYETCVRNAMSRIKGANITAELAGCDRLK